MTTVYVAKEAIHLTDDGRLVPEDDPDGTTLFAGPNRRFTDNDVKMFDTAGAKGLYEDAEGAPLVTSEESPGIRDLPTINPEESVDIHHYPVEERSAAVDKKIANDAGGLTAKITHAPAGGQGAVSDQDLVKAGQSKRARK